VNALIHAGIWTQRAALGLDLAPDEPQSTFDRWTPKVIDMLNNGWLGFQIVNYIALNN
jgi:hypothetical protein